MKRAILPIVEGQGDLAAVPLLLRKLMAHHEIHDIDVLRPHLRGELPKVKSQVARFLQVAALEDAALLWIMDFDCDNCICALKEAKELTSAARGVLGSWPIEFCFIIKEFESLFLAQPERTKACLGIAEEVEFPEDPESVRDAKGFLTRCLPKGKSYKPTIHQPRLASQIDVEDLRNASSSFRHLERALLRLADRLPNAT